MRKKGSEVLLIAVLVIFSALLATQAFGEEELCVPLGELTIEPPDGVDQKRVSVEFPHSLHFEYACKECHHTWAGGADILSCSTSGCHDQLQTPRDEASGKVDAAMAVKYYKKAYHELCLGCHKDIKEKNKALELSNELLEQPLAKTGPTGCIQCHPKE